MGLANTISVLLNFKSDLAGLTRFTSAISARVQQVQALNQQLTSSSSAVSTALQGAAGFLAVGALRSYTGEALQARTAQAKLEQALVQTKQNSASYRGELTAMASALQRVTGIEDEQIAGVQRQLVFAGAQRAQIAELTALTLDFAAAKEVDAVSAAKAVGRALQGEGDELKRYGVEVKDTGDKVANLVAGLGKFRGQSEQAFAALPEGLRQMRVAGKEAQQAAGEAVLTIANPFLSGLASGLGRISARFEEIRSNGSVVMSMFQSLAGSLGNFLGSNLDKLAVLVALLLSLKVASFAANEGLQMVVMGFQLVTGQNLTQMVTGIMSLRKEVGLLKAISMGGWAGALAAGIVAIGAALAAVAVGSVVIGAVERAQLARLDREQQIRDVMWDQAKALNAQIREAHTPAEIAASQATAKKRVDDTRAEIARLEAKEQADREALLRASRSPREVMPRMSMTGEETAELDTLRRLLPIYEGTLKAAMSTKVTQRQAAGNVVSSRDMTEAQKASRELQDRQAIFELETQIREAELDGNVALQERLIAERDQLMILKDLGQDAYDIAVARITVEAAERKKKRDDEAKEKAETAKKEAEEKQQAADRIAAAIAEQQLSQKTAAGEAGLALIEQSKFLTQEQKDRARTTVLEKMNQHIADRISLLEKEQSLKPTPERQGQIDGLRQKQGDNAAVIADLAPLTTGQSVLAGVVQFLNDIPTLAQRAQQTIYGLAQAFSGGVAASITGLINRTMTWRDALMNIGQAVVQSIIGAFANMAAQWITKQIMMALFGKALQVAQLAALAPIATATALMWAPAATAASIATFGGAAVAGAAMAKAAIISSVLGFATGGMIPGGEQLIRVNEGNRQEAVLNHRATVMLGSGFINSVNAGALDFATLPAAVAGQLPAPGEAGAAGGNSSGPGGGRGIAVYNAFFQDRDSALAWLNTKQGVRNLSRIHNDNRDEFGAES